MGAAEWTYIKRQIDKRKREDGKESDVYINGILQPAKKVKYEIGRQGFESTIDRLRDGNYYHSIKGYTSSRLDTDIR